MLAMCDYLCKLHTMETQQEIYGKLIEIEKQLSRGELLERGLASSATKGWVAAVIGVLVILIAVFINLAVIGNVLLLAVGVSMTVGGTIRALRSNSQRWAVARSLVEYKAKKVEYQMQLTTKEQKPQM